ncbi:ROK family transcriptional regulator [Herbiconiux sp. L3-i23]|uniref:ROK family transcriptional regulator n=1 Tax=Herbiconiux sp. L3-i23 TaxID=2905871 RepID=UPI00205C1E8F|nr:ROK family transcriptional regulator [Herbiconiux sp. L3-i23]BDI21486.1 transcriptional regulator [Herbiconiux sp. L3-i23]
MARPRTPAPWPEFAEAQRRVLLELLIGGDESRVRLAERIGLSRASLTRIARELVQLGFIALGEARPSASRGRPEEMLGLRPGAATFVGVKLTGDALYAVALDLGANVIGREEAPLDTREPEGVVDLIAQVAGRLLASHRVPAVIGIGLAGDVLRTGDTEVVERSNFLGWRPSVPLRAMVEEATGVTTVVTNDVHALAAAHHWFGAGRSDASLVVYGLGAGIGSGVVIGGELMEGVHGRSGRIGHSRIGGIGRVCDNGHTDCVHSFVTMPAIEYNSGVQPGEYPLVVQRARDGDPIALDAFRMAAYALGSVIAESVNAFDPEQVTVMGEGLDMLDFASDEVRRALAEYLEQLSPHDVRIERPPFDFGLYAYGAAVSAMRTVLS